MLVVKTALDNFERLVSPLALNAVHKAIVAIDAARPPAAQVLFQRLRLAAFLKWGSSTLFDKLEAARLLQVRSASEWGPSRNGGRNIQGGARQKFKLGHF